LPTAGFVASPSAGKAPLDVLFDASQSLDLDGELVSYLWQFGDGEDGNGEFATHRFVAPSTYRVTLVVSDDRGATASAERTITVEEDLGGLQLPSDTNQDGEVDVSDALRLLLHLFADVGPLPCVGADVQSGGNLALLDGDGNGLVNLTDTIYLLVHLFRGGPPPVLGTSCVPIDGCPDACR
jgi:hypothetical protein